MYDWKSNLEPKKRFAKERKSRQLKAELKVPAKKSHFLWSLKIAEREKQKKRKQVERNAVNTIEGLITIANSSRGPRFRPLVKKIIKIIINKIK